MQSPPFSVSGHTRYFAVLGHPIAHTLSPVMHNAALAALGKDALYLAFDVRADALIEVLHAMGRLGFLGVNLTIPHKEVAFKGVEHLAPTAVRAGSVNTIRFREDGSLEGHSTDGYGLTTALQEAFGRSLAGSSALILGCGGAGRAAALEAAEQGATQIVLANRTLSKARELCRELQALFPGVAFSTPAAWPPPPDTTRGVDIMLNSTSLGMKDGDDVPLTPDHLREGQELLDMTYVMRETPMMAVARAAGARAANGLGMLLHQGVRSFEIWTGETPPVDIMRNALRNAMYGKDPA